MRRNAAALLWIGLYILLVAAPLLVLLLGPRPPGVTLWWDFSMALGFAGIATMGVQFALTARFRRASAPFGLDIVYYFHRYAAIVGLGLILAHFFILWSLYPQALGQLNPLEAPPYMTAGRAALLIFLLVIVSSLWRKRLGIDYYWWRVSHAVLASVGLLLAIFHVLQAGYYTQTPWKLVLWTGLTAFWLFLIAYTRLIKPWRMLKRPYRITRVLPERGTTWTVEVAPEGHDGMRHAPGQFAWLTARGSPFGFGEHPFSFSGGGPGGARERFTIKALGDFTATVKDLQPGERVYLDGPYGVFSVDRYPRAPGFVFIAGGVGITPVMSNLETMAARGDGRPVLLIYANNDWEQVTFRERLDELREQLNLTLVHVLSKPPSDWQGERGFVDQALLQRRLPPEHQQLEYFLCGPKPMSDGVQRALHALGVPRTHVHFEVFNLV